MKRFLMGVFLYASLFNSASAEIISLHKMSEISKKIEQCLEKSKVEDLLTVFDADQVLNSFSKADLNILQDFQKRKIRIIALTNALAGKFIESKNKNIFKQRDAFQKKGFDFTKSLAGFTQVITFQDFPGHAEGFPMFYHGLLSTNGNQTTRGSVLAALLKHIGEKRQSKVGQGYFPKLMIAIESKEENLHDIERLIDKSFPEIYFLGIQYQKHEPK